MNNKTIVILALAILGLGISLWWFVFKDQKTEQLASTHVLSHPKEDVMHHDHYSDGMDDDQLMEETRIILINRDHKELNNLLSEKMIINGKVVDKPKSDR